MLSRSPKSVSLQITEQCQLKCSLCYRQKYVSDIKKGCLTLSNFNNLIDLNPHLKKIDIGGWGEPFLNKNMISFLRISYERGIFTAIDTAANFNDISEETLESLVRYRTLRLRISIDGVTQKTYEKSKNGGQLSKVIDNIHKINLLKAKYKTDKPQLIFHFVIFRYNESEIERAAIMAKMLNMQFLLRLNRSNGRLPASAGLHVRKLLGYADQSEYLKNKKVHYDRQICLQMWRSPRISWDGKLWGCNRNRWGAYEGNVFEQDFLMCLNREKITYARAMLMGQVQAQKNIPCYKCPCYQSMIKYETWISEDEIRQELARSYA
ncbi:MAG: radical SAM protein [Desulfamplus sp.]|nr:radical SAM protein [Desulfamplus sp.]